MLTTTKLLLILLSLAILFRCLRSMLREKYEPEVWAYIRSGKETLPVTHWENIIGRSRSADVQVDKPGVREAIFSGDVINLAGNTVRFQDISPEKQQKLESARTTAGKRFSPALTLLYLTLFQLVLLGQHAIFAAPEHLPAIALGFLSLVMLQWSCYNAMRIIGHLYPG